MSYQDCLASNEVSFGALAPPLAKQLHRPKASVAHLQALADAICLLAIHGVLSEAEVDRARRRLMKELIPHAQLAGRANA